MLNMLKASFYEICSSLFLDVILVPSAYSEDLVIPLYALLNFDFDFYLFSRYYAAFPALHGHGASKNPSPSETIWRNNPLVNKSLASLTSEDDSSSANEDAEIRKINIPGTVIIPRHRKPRKNNTSRNRCENPGSARGRRDKSRGNQKGRQSQKEQQKPQEFPPWPPGFAKLDPVILQNLDILDKELVFVEDCPKRPNDELCTRVESLLKGMLLPVPEKSYKELLDVEVILPEEMRKAPKKMDTASVSKNKQPEDQKKTKERDKLEKEKKEMDSPTPSFRDESISPELKEQEIWYTQPIDVIFHSQDDDEVSNSKLRLYKRNSYPKFSPEPDVSDQTSSASSPVFERNRSISCGSEGSDIFEGSVLIPAWLTEVISADENSDDNGEDIDLSASLKSSSPYLSSSVRSEDPMCLIGDEGKEKYGAAWNDDETLHNRKDEAVIFKDHHDETSTPTPNDDSALEHQKSSESVSLVDWDYLSKFLGNTTPETHPLSSENGLPLSSPRRQGISTLWQSQVLFDYTLNTSDSLTDEFKPLLEVQDFQWQPIGCSPYSQLWDVNMKKRNTKVASWEGSLYLGDNPVWFVDNSLFFMQVSDASDDQCTNDQSGNTLIPQISIDIVPEVETDTISFKEHDITAECGSYQYFDRSVSMGDVPSFWSENTPKKSNPQLSKSFELVPSEHSAFYDVPRKLLHVHSEPNLVQYRQDYADNNHQQTQSPQEHLFFSPKTHFRPITPAYALEPLTPKTKQQLSHDLFGGLPSTKTPYQQYHGIETESQDMSFIPSFKLKNSSKSIQTGESIDKLESPEVSGESEERDTPETLTLSILEDIMNENENERLVTITEDLDTANTDSAYETDYGGNAGVDNEADRSSHASGCIRNGNLYKSHGYSDCEAVDHGHLGEMVDFSVESFMATFPHTQDWPDGACQLMPPPENAWKDMTENDFVAAGFNQLESVSEPESGGAPPFPLSAAGLWGDNVGLDNLFRENDMEPYTKNIWSTADHEYFTLEVEPQAETDNGQSFLDYGEEVYDNVPPDDVLYTTMFQQNDDKKDDDVTEQYDNVPLQETDEQAVGQSDSQDPGLSGYAGFPDTDDVGELEFDNMNEAENYYSVKLVYKDKQRRNGNPSENKVGVKT